MSLRSIEDAQGTREQQYTAISPDNNQAMEVGDSPNYSPMG